MLLLSFLPAALTSCSNKEKPTTSEMKKTEVQEKSEEVKDFVLSSDATYTGSINDKKELSGKGVIKYKNKDTLTGRSKTISPMARWFIPSTNPEILSEGQENS